MTETTTANLIACHECDHLHYHTEIPAGARANCSLCGNLLYRHVPDAIDRTLALYITALLLFIIANSFPFLSLELGGRQVDSILFSSGWVMYELGMAELGLLIFITSILFPLLVICSMLYLLFAARLGVFPPWAGPIFRLVKGLMPWSLIGVFMLGALISIVKLQNLANVILGPALIAFGALLLVYTAARVSFNPAHLWSLSDVKPLTFNLKRQPDTPLLHCHICGLLSPANNHQERCPRCSTPLHHRTPRSIEKTAALLLSAVILFVPANLFPVMTVIQFGQGEPSTILGGVVQLMEANMWGLAMLVFIASIVVPMMKLFILGFLCITVHTGSTWRPRDRTQLYRVTEVVGAWSMVDIFLVGLLSALVSLGTISTIRPEIGAMFFAGVVVITMFAAQSFDSRLIWDPVREKKNANKTENMDNSQK